MQTLSSLFCLSWKLLKAIECFRISWFLPSKGLGVFLEDFLSVCTSITYCRVKHCSALLSEEGWAASFSIRTRSSVRLILMLFIIQRPLKTGIWAPSFGFLLTSAQDFLAGVNVLYLLGPTDLLGWKGTQYIPVVLKDAPWLNLLNSESFEPLFSLLEEEKALFLIKVSSPACCILLWLGGDDARS